MEMKIDRRDTETRRGKDKEQEAKHPPYPSSCFCTSVVLLISLFVLASASVSAEEGLLFSRPLSGVHLMEGLSERRIIYRHGAHIAPRFSPGGQKILFHSKQGGRIGIWLTDLQGEEMERICDGEQANWSPDGKKIVFSREEEIIERELASGEEKIVVTKTLTCNFPSYLPDGRVIFVSDGKIYVNDSHEPLMSGDVRSTPRCSPDGKRIAYQDGAHIYLMNLDDGKISQLTVAGGVQSWPVWSQDGGSICYCQSPEAFGGPWDICVVKIDSPQQVSTVTRDVEISPDWRGSRLLSHAAPELKGSKIRLWQIEGSLAERGSWKVLPENPPESPFDKGGAKRLPSDKGVLAEDSYSVEGKIAVENDWGVFYLSSEKILIFQEPSSNEEVVELVLVNEEGKSATTIESIQVAGNDGENVALRVHFAPEMEAVFTVPRTRPFVEIEPVENVEKVYVKRNMNLVVLPDRFADDLILDPHEYSSEKILLPYAPLSIGLPAEGDMIMIVTSSDDQETWLIKGEKEGIFEGMEVLTAGERMFVSLLSGEVIWHQSDTDGWKTKWSAPFLAQWRIATAGEGKRDSRLWDEEALGKLSQSYLSIEQDFSGIPELSLIYLYGRSWNTPLDIIIPMDILQDALGIDAMKDVLDMEGLRGYRTAEKPVPLHILLTSQGQRLWPEDYPGWPETLDFTPFFSLIKRLHMVDRKGVKSTAAHLCGDILNSLKGLDDRIEEYEGFLNNMEQSAGLLGMEKDAQNLRRELASLSITKIEKVSDSIQAIIKLSGTDEWLWDIDQLSEFQRISGLALLERQTVLSKYRGFAKKLRDTAGVNITKNPETKRKFEKIRGLVQNILRERYYLEGDWRGEKPL